MSETRAALRAKLARAVQRYFAGTATGGSTTTIVDTSGLERWSETDALKGAYVLITEADSAAPEGESARIKSFNPTSNTITFDTTLSAAVEAGDSYELYLAPLSLDDWNECVNNAILSAWPELYLVEVDQLAAGPGPEWYLTSSCGIEAIISIHLVRYIPDDTYPAQRVPRAQYDVVHNPGYEPVVYFHRPPGWPGAFHYRVIGKKRYAALSTETTATDLDPAYILAAGRAEWYQMMADAGRGQADRSALLQLMNHWQQVADQRKRALALDLQGSQLPPERKTR